MPGILEKISQITIYLKSSEGAEERAERINEVALFQPLSRKSSFNAETKAFKKRKWTFYSQLPFSRRIFLKIQTFFFHKLHLFASQERKTPEAKFKTAIAILLSQEALREFFLGSSEKQQHFFQAAQKGAVAIGYDKFVPPVEDTPLKIAKKLTKLPWKEGNLIEDSAELNLQMATLSTFERDEILFAILNDIERPPVVSVLEIAHEEKSSLLNIEMTTTYGKFHIYQIDENGKIEFDGHENKATSSIETLKNITPGAKGVMNQRRVLDTSDSSNPYLIGAYSGQLTTTYHVLEQILFILGEDLNSTFFLLDHSDSTGAIEDKTFAFTSLFSWNEFQKIQSQNNSIDQLHEKIVKIVKHDGRTKYVRLHLYHQNIPFNALNKFPVPSEMKATLNDLNDEMLIAFTLKILKFLKIDKFPQLESLAHSMNESRKNKDYLLKQKAILKIVDTWRDLIDPIVANLDAFISITPPEKESFATAVSLKALLVKKHGPHKKLSGMDYLIYTTILMKNLKVLHNKNCEHSTDRSSGANAADKAQNAFIKIRGRPFLPVVASENEQALFKVLYSMYLVWEEPELNAGLSTGFIGEKFFNNFIQRNPETTHYLTTWLKNHPEMYLGLSEYRH